MNPGKIHWLISRWEEDFSVFSTKELRRNAGDCGLHVPVDIPVIKEAERGQETTSVEELWGGNDMLLALSRVAFICIILQKSYT